MKEINFKGDFRNIKILPNVTNTTGRYFLANYMLRPTNKSISSHTSFPTCDDNGVPNGKIIVCKSGGALHTKIKILSIKIIINSI